MPQFENALAFISCDGWMPQFSWTCICNCCLWWRNTTVL